MPKKTSFTFPLNAAQQARLVEIIRTGNYRPREVPHTRIAAEGSDCQIALFKSGKCLVQGQGAEDWVLFTLEPEVLQQAGVGYEQVLHPEAAQPHMGIDESGKGDFFGPLVIAAVYVDEQLVPAMQEMNIRDSKTISSDRVARDLARKIRELVGDRWTLVTIGPRKYNELYARIRNVNRLLAWGHARAIENLLEKVPGCPRALSDQFGPTRQIEMALMKKGKRIKLEQRHKAESDMAVAAASILARAGFLDGLQKIGERFDLAIPKGASTQVQEVACQLVAKQGPAILLETSKCHFRTTDAVLEKCGASRAALGPDGQVVSKTREEKAEEAAG